MDTPPRSTSAWRAIGASAAIHVALAGVVWAIARGGSGPTAPTYTEIDLTMAPPVDEAEVMAPEVGGAGDDDGDEASGDPAGGGGPLDPPAPAAGTFPIDARPAEPTPDAAPELAAAPAPDARPRRRRLPPPDTTTDVGSGSGSGSGAATQAGSGSGSASSTGSGSGSGSGAGSGSASVGEPGDSGGAGGAGTIASAATKANLLTYFPRGQALAIMLRFDRLRGTRWAAPASGLFAVMHDYETIVGDRKTQLDTLFDTFVIASPRPQDPTATTLVAHSLQTRPVLRDYLDEPDAPVTWSVATGGLLGTRAPGARVVDGDQRQFLSPYLGWFVLAPPTSLTGLTEPATGELDLDTAVATVALPRWLAGLRNIEAEAGTGSGPALLMTMATKPRRYGLPAAARMLLAIPDAETIPSPSRLTATVTLVALGLEIKGHAVFATPEDAREVFTVVQAVIAAQAEADATSMWAALGKMSVREPTDNTLTYSLSLSTKQGIDGLTYATGVLASYYAEREAGASP